jgi:hypothetical protein
VLDLVIFVATLVYESQLWRGCVLTWPIPRTVNEDAGNKQYVWLLLDVYVIYVSKGENG